MLLIFLVIDRCLKICCKKIYYKSKCLIFRLKLFFLQNNVVCMQVSLKTTTKNDRIQNKEQRKIHYKKIRDILKDIKF